MSSRTTAHLSSYSDDGFGELIKVRGLDIAKGWYESQAASIARIEAIEKEIGASFDFQRLDGCLFLAPETDPSVLDSEFDACSQVGIAAFRETGAPFRGHETTQALRFPQQARFYPTKYLAALAGAIRQAGGRFFAQEPVVQVQEDGGGAFVATMSGRKITANAVVVATNSPINEAVAIHTKQAPYRTYAAAFEIARGALPDALYWDTLDPYHYVRLQPGDAGVDLLIVGGEDHKTGESDTGHERIASLASWMRTLLPDLGPEVARWSGQVLEPVDYMGFIGRNPGEQRVYVATGDSGQGMTHGVVAGMLISDLILRGESEWESVYDPARKPIKAAGEYLKENLTAVKSYAEFLAPAEISSYDELKPGKGAVVREGLQKVAAFRDDAGALLRCSAACTHLDCQVRWNSFERCWDCPCHGSHFAPDGEAINAPAFSPLPPVDG
jgi:hypothetical protein